MSLRDISLAEGEHKAPAIREWSREEILEALAIYGVEQATKNDRGDLLSLAFLLDADDPVSVARGTGGGEMAMAREVPVYIQCRHCPVCGRAISHGHDCPEFLADRERRLLDVVDSARMLSQANEGRRDGREWALLLAALARLDAQRSAGSD